MTIGKTHLTLDKVKKYNLNITEVLVSDFKNDFARNFQFHRRDSITQWKLFEGVFIENFEKRLEDREPCHYICTKQDGWLRPGGLAAIRRIVSDDIKSTKNEIKKDLANKLSSY